MLACSIILTTTMFFGRQEAPPYVGEAQRLVESLKGSPMNVYGGGKRFIKWDEKPIEARTVCSSFVTLLMEKTYGWSHDDIKTWLGSTNPQAEDYHDAISSKNGFLKIIHISAVKPGDILAVKYNDGHVSRNGVEDTGHVMVVSDVPTEVKSSKTQSGDTAYNVTVFDSSASGHGKSDTRFQGGKSFTGGIGRGIFRIYADSNGEIAAYAWSDGKNSELFKSPARDLLIGRLDPSRLPISIKK